MSKQPKYQRRKEDRPQEIADAAFAGAVSRGFGAGAVTEPTSAAVVGGETGSGTAATAARAPIS